MYRTGYGKILLKMSYLLRKSVKLVCRRATFRAKSGLYCHFEPHMNELPVPCGPWKTWYDRRQARLNKTLAIGLIWFAISLASAVSAGTFDSRFFCAPDNPGPREVFEESDAESAANDPCAKK